MHLVPVEKESLEPCVHIISRMLGKDMLLFFWNRRNKIQQHLKYLPARGESKTVPPLAPKD